jgi:hypothetical protein
MLLAGRFRIRFPMRSLHFSFEIILPSALWHLGRLNFKEKLVPGIYLRIKGGRPVQG